MAKVPRFLSKRDSDVDSYYNGSYSYQNIDEDQNGGSRRKEEKQSRISQDEDEEYSIKFGSKYKSDFNEISKDLNLT
jgi:hypothetical protein